MRFERLLLDGAQPDVAVDGQDLQAGVLDPGPQLAPLGGGQPDVGELVVRGPQLETGKVVAFGKLQDVVEGLAGTAQGGEAE